MTTQTNPDASKPCLPLDLGSKNTHDASATKSVAVSWVCNVEMRGMSDNLALVEQKLSDSLRVAAVSADFEVDQGCRSSSRSSNIRVVQNKEPQQVIVEELRALGSNRIVSTTQSWPMCTSRNPEGNTSLPAPTDSCCLPPFYVLLGEWAERSR